jgi:integrase/recombinase XerC
MVLLMLLGGLRAAEARGPLLAEEMLAGGRCGWSARVAGNGWFRWTGRSSLSSLSIYGLSDRRDCATQQCFVVLRGPTAGQPLTEAGMRRIFRTHRARSGAARVRPQRLRVRGTQVWPLRAKR